MSESMDELYTTPPQSEEQARKELEQRAFAEWIKGIVTVSNEKADEQVKSIRKIQASLQVHLLELPRIKGMLKELGLSWSQLKARVNYSDIIELSVELGNETFREFYMKHRDTLQLDQYGSEAKFTKKITAKVSVLISAESLTKAELTKFQETPTPSVTDDLPL